MTSERHWTATEDLPSLKRTFDDRGRRGFAELMTTWATTERPCQTCRGLGGGSGDIVKLVEDLDEAETLSNLEMTWMASEAFAEVVKDLVLSLERYCRLLSPFGTEFKDIWSLSMF